MTRVLVTGAGGFIGRRVVAHLRESGCDVAIVSVEGDSGDGTIVGDLRDPALLRGRLHDVDAVVHLAARSGGVGFQRAQDPSVFHDNRAMTDGVLNALAERGGGRLLLASSSVVYRPRSDRPHSEDDPRLGPDDHPSPYAWGKVCDEVVAEWHRSLGLSVAIGRFANVYGPGGPSDDVNGTVVHSLIRRALEAVDAGESTFEVRGSPSVVRSFVFVDDVARAVVKLVLSPEAVGAYNIDTGVGVSIADLASAVALAVAGGLRPILSAEAAPADIPYRVTDPRRLGELGVWADTALREGIAACVGAARSD